VETAEGTGAEGTGAEVAANDLGTTSTEGVGDGNAVSSSAEEPILYEVQAGGKTEKVTFEEMQKGYMRQADYTRKTQEVATERQRVQQLQQLSTALENNPRETLTALARALNVDIGTAAAALAPQGDEEDPIARLERGFQSLSQQITSRAQTEQQARDTANRAAQIKSQIDNEMAQLHSQHGDFPDTELIQYAVDRGLTNLDVAFRSWRYDALEAQRIAEANAATEAKRRAQVVGGGTTTSASSIVPGTAGSKPSVREAWAMARAAEPQ
jgi:hypothetical protein